MMFIMAVINKPACIIADEPTTALDIWHTAEQLRLWKSVCKEHRITLILITHDLSLVRQLADEVIFLKDGKLIFQAEKHLFFEGSASMEASQFVADYFYFENRPKPYLQRDKNKDVLLNAENIYKSYTEHSLWMKPAQTEVLSAISFTLRKGVTLGITGSSGSGKTTLLMCLLKLTGTDGGRLFWKNTEVTSTPENLLRTQRRDFQIVFQDAYRSMPYFMSVKQIMEEASRAAGNLVNEGRIFEILDQVKLSKNTFHQPAASLSGGEFQRLSLARALVMSPGLIILDEPFSAMDPSLQRQMVELILKCQRENDCAIILVSHNIALIQYLADDLLVLESGKVTDFGAVEDVISKPSDSFKKLLQAFES
jgi:ABC-type glutathione transport system ATPase component